MLDKNKNSRYSYIIDILKRIYKLTPNFICKILYRFYVNRNTKVGIINRYLYVSKFSKSAGNNIYIAPFVVLKNIEKIEFGSNVSIHEFCYIDGYGAIKIGDNVSIAHSSSLISSNHTATDINIPIKYNEVEVGKITISNDVWIGCGVRILANTFINQRVIVAAGAVVSRTELESYFIYGGVPVHKLKKIPDSVK